ncbi:XRRM domain-containing protein [Heracleum sosnowskyi]|uniref:XRRM domain-containing protein n=1 Tax=Heracleum sosnowskyi TaxID=360622 RepID=A0AAD8J321_9APIA|nr:XRRM domain-containing protein [Heracleum sosnowskyi]KAK1396336.1 XRRM domain-containing protein [Heracleum sosnowskyi]
MVEDEPTLESVQAEQGKESPDIPIQKEEAKAGTEGAATLYKDNKDVVLREDLKKVFQKFGFVKSPESKKNEHPDSPSTKSEQGLDTEAELAMLESEFGKVNTADEICDLEIDELERQLRSGETTSSK